MIAKQRVYLNHDRSAAVPEGDRDARFLLVAAGTEIADSQLDKIEGARQLAEIKASEPRKKFDIPPESRPAKTAAK